MADIDKALPNIKVQPEETTEDLAVEMIEEIEKVQPGETQITEMEDGSVNVDFDPQALKQSQATDFNANLADFIEDDELGYLSSTKSAKFALKSAASDCFNASGSKLTSTDPSSISVI